MSSRMDLWIVRHGPNDLGLSETYDRLRGLIAEGEKCVRMVAAKMKVDGEVPRVILASPFARTMETADIMGEVFGGVRVAPSTDLCPWHPLLPYLSTFMGHVDSGIMMVGHHTSFEMLLDMIGDKVAPSILACGEARRYEVTLDECGWKMCLRYRCTPIDAGMKDMIV